VANPIVQSTALQVVNAAQYASATLSGVKAGNAIVVTASVYSPNANDAPLVKDGSTTLTQVSAYTPGGNYSSAVVAWELNVAAGSHTITVQFTSKITSGYYVFEAHEVSGLGSTQPSVSTTGTTTGSTLALSGATPSQSGCIVFTAIADDGSGSSSTGAATTPSGYTSLWQEMAGASYQIGAAAYQVQSTAAPVSPSWTGLNSAGGAGWSAVAVAFAPAGSSGVSASAAKTDSADNQAASGTITAPTVAAQAAQTDSADSQAASGTLTIVVQATQTDGADSQASSGTLTIIAQATQADGADSQAASGTLTVLAQAAQTDGADNQAASATVATLTPTAQAAQTDGADNQAASGTVTIFAQAAQTDGTDSQTASGTLTIIAQAAQTDGADNQAASGTLTTGVQASAAQTDGADSQAASGTLTVIAQTAQTDGADSQAASGVLTIIVQAAQIDGADTQAASGILGVNIVAVQVDSTDTQSASVVPNPSIVVTAVQVNGADVQVASLNFNYNTLNEAYLYASQQAATPQFYTMSPPPQANTAVYTQSGTFTVPAYSNYFLVSATAAGGSPYGAAGRQTSRQSLPVAAGDVLTVSISPNVTVQRGAQTLLSLLDGAAYAKGTQGGLPQDSGIVGLGSGVDEGVPFPAALVFIWN